MLPNISLLNLAIVAVTCIVSWLAFKDAKLMQRLLLWPPAVEKKHEYWRLLSYGLVHADFQHLLFNMITLFFFGSAVATLFTFALGSLGFLWFYLGGLLVSILPTYLKNRRNANYYSLGASGAVSAVMFAFILWRPWSLIIVFVIPVPAILYAVVFLGYSIYMDHRGGGYVNHSAHSWGAAYGVLATILVEPRITVSFVQQLLHPAFGM